MSPPLSRLQRLPPKGTTAFAAGRPLLAVPDFGACPLNAPLLYGALR
jgi:hypothetical protein